MYGKKCVYMNHIDAHILVQIVSFYTTIILVVIISSYHHSNMNSQNKSNFQSFLFPLIENFIDFCTSVRSFLFGCNYCGLSVMS